MLTLLRRVSQLSRPRDLRDERMARPPGPIASMMSCDINNIERLTRALAGRR